MADGTYAYAALQIDLAGNLGPISQFLPVTIDTTNPLAPGVPDLQAVHLRAVESLVIRWRGQGRVDLPGRVGVVRASGRLVLLPPEERGGDARIDHDFEEPDA